MNFTNIILTGVKGVGKSTYGKELADKTRYRFIDTDRVMENHYLQQEGMKLSCREIYRERGEYYFRELEHQVISSLIGSQKSVIALGGGTILSEKNRVVVSALGRIVCLHLDFAEVKRRWKAMGLLFKQESEFADLYNRRMSAIRELACTWVRADSEKAIQILEELLIGK